MRQYPITMFSFILEMSSPEFTRLLARFVLVLACTLPSLISSDNGPRSTVLGSIHHKSKYSAQYDDGVVKNCALDAESLYPYLVKISFQYLNKDDLIEREAMAHGAIISPLLVITSCSALVEKQPKCQIDDCYMIYAQRIMHVIDGVEYVCAIRNYWTGRMDHPKCSGEKHFSILPKHRTQSMFDFSMLAFKKPWPADNSVVYPSMLLPRTPLEMLYYIRWINTAGYAVWGCEIPHFRTKAYDDVTMYPTGDVGPRPWLSYCVPGICLGIEAGIFYPKGYQACLEKNTKNILNDSFLCLDPKSQSILKPEDTDIYRGAPLVCNGTGIGSFMFSNERPKGVKDFYVVTTYFRVWKWIQNHRENWAEELPLFGRDSDDSIYLEEHKFQFEKYTGRTFVLHPMEPDPKRFAGTLNSRGFDVCRSMHWTWIIWSIAIHSSF